MNEQRTEHLVFMPCSISMARSLLLHGNTLREYAPIDIPESFPSIRARAILPLMIEGLELELEPLSWIWYVIDIKKRRMIGELILGKRMYDDHTLQFTFSFDTVDSEVAYAEDSVEWLLCFLANTEIKYVLTEMKEEAFMAKAMLEQKGFHCFEKGGYIQLVRKIS